MPLLLVSRDTFSDAKATLGSWDKCMAKTYCKWPVIVGIIIGSLIILSLVLCIARCLCCGAEVACCCFKCCTCCCPSGRGQKGHKRMDSTKPPPLYPSPYQPAPMAPPSYPTNDQYRSHATPAYRGVEAERPQFATFDAPSKPVNEDALPAMPSWTDARDVHVEEAVIPEKQGDMEMERLNHNGSVTNSSVTAAAVAGGARRSPGRSPVQQSPTHDAYGFPEGYQAEPFVGAAPHRSPHSTPAPYGHPRNQQYDDYRRGPPNQSISPVYGTGAGYAQNQQYDRHTPSPSHNQGYSRPAPTRSPLQRNAYEDSYGGYSDHPNEGHAPSPIDYHNNNYAPASAPVRSHTPTYAVSSPTEHAPLAASYPGQESYQSPTSAYPGQATYQAFRPQDSQQAGVMRKPVDGSWKEI